MYLIPLSAQENASSCNSAYALNIPNIPLGESAQLEIADSEVGRRIENVLLLFRSYLQQLPSSTKSSFACLRPVSCHPGFARKGADRNTGRSSWLLVILFGSLCGALASCMQ